MSTKHYQQAKAHASRAYQCSACGKVVLGNGGRASHRYMHERRGESCGMPPYVRGYATFVDFSKAAFIIDHKAG